MPENKPLTDPGDAPDLSSLEYHAKFAVVPVRRGRPKGKSPKVPFSPRLAADIVESLRASGPGYNLRVETALRKAGFGATKKRAVRKKAATKRPARPQKIERDAMNVHHCSYTGCTKSGDWPDDALGSGLSQVHQMITAAIMTAAAKLAASLS
jgi:uncharacterized protein (DUF4415 family)